MTSAGRARVAAVLLAACSGAPPDDAPPDGACPTGARSATGTLGVAPACAPDASCPGTDVCLATGRCARPCSRTDECGGAERCVHAFAWSGDVLTERSACAPDIATTDRTVVRAERRTIARGETLTVAATDAAEAHTAVLEVVCGAAPRLATLTAGGSTLFSPEAGARTNPVLTARSPLTLLVPNGAFPAPTFELTFGPAEAAAVVDVTVLARSPGGAPAPLGLALFYVGGGGLRPDGARGPPAVEAALAELETVLARGGRALGAVTQHVVDAPTASRFAVVDEDDASSAADLQRLAHGVLDALPVFFVRSLAGGRLGETGSIPIAWGRSGTAASGVIVAVDAIGPGDGLARVLAHEVGHALGLFHTTDPDGTTIEALASTPVCDPALDADGDAVLSAAECREHGGDNLMFWAAAQLRTTREQDGVLSRR